MQVVHVVGLAELLALPWVDFLAFAISVQGEQLIWWGHGHIVNVKLSSNKEFFVVLLEGGLVFDDGVGYIAVLKRLLMLELC